MAVNGKGAEVPPRSVLGTRYATRSCSRLTETVDKVLVDPPFARTVSGKCVADELSLEHMLSFGGYNDYFRLRFYIAP